MNDDEALAMERDWNAVLHRREPGESWEARWQRARKNVRGVAAGPEVNTYRSDGRFAYTLNIHEDAFRAATETLQDRERRFGARSAVFTSWVRAQDLVFAEAPSKEVEAVPVPAGAAAIAHADRAYQAAAAAFYQEEYDEAQKRFLAIAGDATSPWRGYGTYLAARVALRQKNYDETKRLLEAVVADRSLAKLHTSARGLLLRVRMMQEPDEHFRPSLADAVMAPRPGPLFGVIVRHLVLAIDRYSSPKSESGPDVAADDERDLFPGEEPSSGRDYETNESWRYSRTSSLRAEHELLDWIVTFQSTDSAAAAHAVNRWRQTRRVPWLVAAISGLRSMKATGAADVMAAAAAVPHESPAYATATFHRARLLIEGGRRDEARALLDGVLGGSRLPMSSTNRFHDLRLQTAQTVDDLVADLDVQAAGLHAVDYPNYRFSPFAKGCGDGEMTNTCDQLRANARRPQVLPRAAGLIDGLTLDLIAKLAADTRLPDSVRLEIAQAGWVRAFVLADDERLRSLALELSNQYAAADSPLSSQLSRVGSSATPDERRFEAALILVKYPVMAPFVRPGLMRLLAPSTIDDYRDNWWDQPRLRANAKDDDAAGVLLRPAPFLDANARRRVEGEHLRLRSAGPAGSFIARAIVEGSGQRLNDPRVPEALYRAVRATRLAGGGEWSRKAYALLHKQYPNDPWAKRTRFWY